MNKINFTAKDNFPLSSDTMDMMQQMIGSSANMALLGGSNYILSGCVDDGTSVSSGTIVIDGELLPFQGGTKKTKITIQQTTKSLDAFGTSYPEAYVYRTAMFSETGEYIWADFSQVKTNEYIYNILKMVESEPIGCVKMWAGLQTKLPDGYMLCNGAELQTTDYPELHDVVKYTYGGSGGVFKIPNIKRRIPIGSDPDDTSEYEFNILGKMGGEEKHLLSIEEIPQHSHNILGSAADVGNPGSYFIQANSEQVNAGSTQTSGGEKPHNNIQPYIVLHYIIKVK